MADELAIPKNRDWELKHALGFLSNFGVNLLAISKNRDWELKLQGFWNAPSGDREIAISKNRDWELKQFTTHIFMSCQLFQMPMCICE